MKLFSFHTILFTCKCGCKMVYSDAEIVVDPNGNYVEGVDIVYNKRLVVRYTHNPVSVKAARQNLCDLLIEEEVDSDAALPVLSSFIDHVSKTLDT